ncbi:MAG: hypothetical protein KA392_00680 [Candidatus Obscuribacter sp.]|nr:hypothetical protein [Candidatus Obscuribacter sp.]MBP7575091.1 hypothetical protein [Candidatus Obscuribacter sp.]
MKPNHNNDRLALAYVLYGRLLRANGAMGSIARAIESAKYFVARVVASQLVFAFDQGHEGSFDADLRGGKGLGLSNMKRLGKPVPGGATVLTSVSRHFERTGRLPGRLALEIVDVIASMEEETGSGFGDIEKPLLISVRSGAPVSIAGTMDTVLNVGLTRQCIPALARRAGERFAWDCYRRYLTMFAVTVLGVERQVFEAPLKAVMHQAGVARDSDLSVSDLQMLCSEFEIVFGRHCGMRLPDDPYEQLALAIVTVLESWQSERACALRLAEGIAPWLGTAVNLQVMVFGNKGEDSGTGVVFSANPITGEDGIYGEFLSNAQGEDVVSGTRNADSVQLLQQTMPRVYDQLVSHAASLSESYREMVEIEFTIESGVLYLLQVRKAKRAKQAAINFAVNQVKKGLWIEEDGLMSIGSMLDEGDSSALGCARFKPDCLSAVMSLCYMTGIPASPGVVSGHLYFTLESALAAIERDEDVILARMDTYPSDLPVMLKSKGIITACGGATSHAALVARGRQIPAIVACGFTIADNTLTADLYENGLKQEGGSITLIEGELVSIDGGAGLVLPGLVEIEVTEASQNVNLVRKWYSETELRLSASFLDASLANEKWDINQWHNDFYLLNSMAASSTGNDFHVQVVAKQTEVEFQLAQILTCYLTIAVYSELNHLPRYAKEVGRPGCALLELGELDNSMLVLDKMRRLAQQDWSYQVEFFRLASRGFLDNGGSSGFCGRPWSLIAAAPAQYLAGELPASIYIDHVFDLKHNGGRLFDKSGMVAINEHLLRHQLEIKKSVSDTSALYNQLTAACRVVSPAVLELYDAGAELGLWHKRIIEQVDTGGELDEQVLDPEPTEIVGDDDAVLFDLSEDRDGDALATDGCEVGDEDAVVSDGSAEKDADHLVGDKQ